MTYRFRAGFQRRWSRSWSRVMRSEERFDLENTPFRFRKPLRPIRLQKKKNVSVIVAVVVILA